MIHLHATVIYRRIKVAMIPSDVNTRPEVNINILSLSNTMGIYKWILL